MYERVIRYAVEQHHPRVPTVYILILPPNYLHTPRAMVLEIAGYVYNNRMKCIKRRTSTKDLVQLLAADRSQSSLELGCGEEVQVVLPSQHVKDAIGKAWEEKEQLERRGKRPPLSLTGYWSPEDIKHHLEEIATGEEWLEDVQIAAGMSQCIVFFGAIRGHVGFVWENGEYFATQEASSAIMVAYTRGIGIAILQDDDDFLYNSAATGKHEFQVNLLAKFSNACVW